ncbi:hypothetical protein WBJ53_18775 [Spirosoma sp. SC4-14]|uniref:hypothetical protein n=1 Tax=Spirosoma sp. SC4-14 TaxID=3128900 RepID=UPI0030CF2633
MRKLQGISWLNVLILVLLFTPDKAPAQSLPALPTHRFDTLIYEHHAVVRSGETLRFPPGSHLLDIRWLKRMGASLITFTDGTTFKESPVDHSYVLETIGIYDEKTDNYAEYPIHYGDANWQQQCQESAREAASITARSGGEFQISYFTLQPLKAPDK